MSKAAIDKVEVRVPLHPEPLHDPLARDIARYGDGDDRLGTELIEAEFQ